MSFSRVLTLALVLAAAGCTEAPPASTPAPDPVGTLVEALDSGIAEASLAVLGDNVTIVAVGGPVHAWRGLATGGNFDRVDAPVGPGDTDLAQAEGILHHVGLAGDGYRVPVQRSLDGGRTWSAPIELARDVAAVDRPFLAASGDRVVVVWGQLFSMTHLMASVSEDQGVTWSTPSAHALLAGGGTMGDVALDPTDGRIFAAWAVDAPPSVRVSISNDGRSWTQRQVAPFSSFSFPSVAVDESGAVYVVWSAPEDGRAPFARVHGGPFAVATRVYLSVSLDRGDTWSPPLDLVPAGSVGWYPAVAAGEEGRIVVAWYEVDAGANDGRGRLALAVSDDARSPAPSFTRVDPVAEPVPIGIFCESDVKCRSDRNVGEVLEVALRPDGAPAVAWTQRGAGGAEVHYASPSRPE